MQIKALTTTSQLIAFAERQVPIEDVLPTDDTYFLSHPTHLVSGPSDEDARVSLNNRSRPTPAKSASFRTLFMMENDGNGGDDETQADDSASMRRVFAMILEAREKGPQFLKDELQDPSFADLPFERQCEFLDAIRQMSSTPLDFWRPIMPEVFRTIESKDLSPKEKHTLFAQKLYFGGLKTADFAYLSDLQDFNIILDAFGTSLRVRIEAFASPKEFSSYQTALNHLETRVGEKLLNGEGNMKQMLEFAYAVGTKTKHAGLMKRIYEEAFPTYHRGQKGYAFLSVMFALLSGIKMDTTQLITTSPGDVAGEYGRLAVLLELLTLDPAGAATRLRELAESASSPIIKRIAEKTSGWLEKKIAGTFRPYAALEDDDFDAILAEAALEDDDFDAILAEDESALNVMALESLITGMVTGEDVFRRVLRDLAKCYDAESMAESFS